MKLNKNYGLIATRNWTGGPFLSGDVDGPVPTIFGGGMCEDLVSHPFPCDGVSCDLPRVCHAAAGIYKESRELYETIASDCGDVGYCGKSLWRYNSI